MNIQDAPWELLNEPGRQQPYVSGKANQINLMLLQSSHDFAIMLGPVFVLGWNYQRGEPKVTGRFNSARISAIRNDDPDTGVGNPTGGDVLRDSFEV